MSVFSDRSRAHRPCTQTQLAQEMKRLQGRVCFQHRVFKRIRKKAQAADAHRLDAFNKALDAAVQGEESLRQKRWDDAIGVIDALGCNATEKERADAFSEEREAYDAWYEFTLPSSRQRFEFELNFILLANER